jgi:hypothetical protein
MKPLPLTILSTLVLALGALGPTAASAQDPPGFAPGDANVFIGP